MDYGRLDLADRLAAEYVAGLLRGAARRRFEALLPAHPALRAAVREWRDRLMPLTLPVEPVAPSRTLWPRIAAALDGRAAATSAVPDAAATPRSTPILPTGAPPAAAATGRPGGLAGLAFWRWTTAFAGIAALALALRLAMPAPVHPPIVVVLAPAAPVATAAEGGVTTTGFVAGISADGRALVTRPLQVGAPPPNHALELWSLPAAGAPRSLGLIAADRATVVERGRVLDGTTAFAVSLEPPGGSPTGAPTGPVLYVGKLGA